MRFGGNLFLRFLVLAAAVSVVILPSCRSEYNRFHEGVTVLEFSQDTIRFDTIFTNQASITQRFTVRNPYKEAVRIDHIYLASGTDSRFRINVSGNTDLSQSGVLIGGKDSLYVFVNTWIDYANRNNPFEIVDYLVFEVNQSPGQQVVLTAWGQDAVYWKSDKTVKVPFYDPGMFNPDADSLLVSYFDYDESIHDFQDAKPYVIYGYMAVGAGKELVIPAGTRIYFAPKSGIWVQAGAKLRIEGALGSPVYMSSIRQDGDYRNTKGQWGRIWLDAESGPHRVDYAFLRNGQTGFWLDSCVLTEGGLDINNTRIENMSSYGIFSNGNRVSGKNLCIAETQSGLYLYRGGDYTFTHCTFSNIGSGSLRGLMLCDYVKDYNTGATTSFPLEKLQFANCSFSGYGSRQVYMDLEKEFSEYGQILFSHCLITLTPEEKENPRFVDCLWNEEPGFGDAENYDFHIADSSSKLIGSGSPAYLQGVCLYDLDGVSRRNPPAVGAYEYTGDVEAGTKAFFRR